MRAYFGYGSNMDADQMLARCPDAKLEGVAVLREHRLMITADGYATISPEPGARVMGALWTVSQADERALDIYEDIGAGLYRRAFVQVERAGKCIEALVYVAENDKPGRPRPGYLELVVAAARKLALPESYIAELERGRLTPDD